MIIAIPDITLICVGSLKNRHLAELTAMYLTRLNHEARIAIREIKDSIPKMEDEKIKRLLDKLDGYSFALSEEGRTYGSRQFASRLQVITGKIIFIIGGPEGLSDRVKKGANEVLSLSSFTFTHEMARMLLIEQLYRTCSILHNRSYHKD